VESHEASIEAAKVEVVSRKGGLEKKHVDKYMGKAKVELKNLVFSQKV